MGKQAMTLIFVCLVMGGWTIGHAQEPLIFFSTAADPDTDQGLRDEMGYALETGTLVHGAGAMRYLILDGSLKDGYTYAIMREVAKFIIWHSEHWNGPRYTQAENMTTLFFSDGPLRLSCGKISSFFRQLAEASLDLPRSHWRYLSIYDYRALDPASVQRGYYLDGGHAIIEIWFAEYGKWGMIDLDYGLIPQDATGVPLNMLDLSRMTADEIAAVITPLGQDRYGKGAASDRRKEAFYEQARHIFSVYDRTATPPTYRFLYTGPEGQGAQFRRNFLDTYDVPPDLPDIEAEIILDAATFAAHYYSPPPPVH